MAEKDNLPALAAALAEVLGLAEWTERSAATGQRTLVGSGSLAGLSLAWELIDGRIEIGEPCPAWHSDPAAAAELRDEMVRRGYVFYLIEQASGADAACEAPDDDRSELALWVSDVETPELATMLAACRALGVPGA